MAEINPADYILIKDRDSNLYSAKNRVLYKHDWEDKISPTSIKEIKPLMMGGWTSFKHINEDGLVTKLRGKEIFYFSPIDGRVARFVAGSDWAYLNCRGSPFYSNGGLGVRESRKNFEV